MIQIYTTPTCHFCDEAKQYLSELGMEYESFDVTKDKEKLSEMRSLSGRSSVPVIVIGSKVLVGFDKTAVDDALSSQAEESRE